MLYVNLLHDDLGYVMWQAASRYFPGMYYLVWSSRLDIRKPLTESRYRICPFLYYYQSFEPSNIQAGMIVRSLHHLRRPRC
jgi:hypothetical protein